MAGRAGAGGDYGSRNTKQLVVTGTQSVRKKKETKAGAQLSSFSLRA